MSRIVSVWLPRWPILRFLAVQAKNPSDKPVDPDRPFVLAVTAAGGPRIAALNEAAEATGLARGEPLADARAKAGPLQVRALDQAADDAALRRLALWATRYTPTASSWDEENGADGFFLDIEGAAHLFGGEESLIADLSSRLERSFGLLARLAVADTPGTAWALSRFHPAPYCVLPPGEEAEALKPLPIEALRLSPETCTTLRRLGFKSVGSLLDKPRAPFAARFPAELLRRVDQALGHIDEPLVPIVAPPVYHSLRYLLEPIITQEAVVALASRLMQTLTHVLTRDDVGARALRLSLYRVDGAVETVDIGLTLPTRDVSHVARLIDLKLEAVAATQDAGFGFEAIGLGVTRAEPTARQNEFTSFGEDTDEADRTERCAVLVDKLRQRLGPQSVRRFTAVASHIPERAEVLLPVTGEASASWPQPELQQTRPLLLLPHAEPTEVTALVPDGPPRRFRWRGVTYEVAGSQGPERIAHEWWRQGNLTARSRTGGNPVPDEEEKPGSRLRGDEREHALTRDYYLVEDADGHRFWLYREGLYERETTAARWFVHGLFA
jgi:protein ImuB